MSREGLSLSGKGEASSKRRGRQVFPKKQATAQRKGQKERGYQQKKKAARNGGKERTDIKGTKKGKN